MDSILPFVCSLPAADPPGGPPLMDPPAGQGPAEPAHGASSPPPLTHSIGQVPLQQQERLGAKRTPLPEAGATPAAARPLPVTPGRDTPGRPGGCGTCP